MGVIGEVVAGAGVDDASGAVDEKPLTVGGPTVAEDGGEVSALSTDAGNEEREFGGQLANPSQFIGISGSNDES